MRRASTILITLIIALSFLTVARADSTFSHTFDLTATDGDFVIDSDMSFWSTTRGEWLAGIGWVAIPTRRVGYPAQQANLLAMIWTLPESVDITSISATFNFAKGPYDQTVGERFVRLTVDGAITTMEVPATLDNGNNQTIVVPGVRTLTQVRIDGLSCWTETDCPTLGNVTITSLTIVGPGDTDPFEAGRSTGPFKPISSPDQISISADHRQVSTQQNANAHSIGDGKVMEVLSTPGQFTIIVQPPGTIGPDAAIYYQNLKTVNAKKGDQINAGCVIGLVRDDTSGTQATPVGKFLFSADATTLADWPEYDDAPNNDPCDGNEFKTLKCLDINPNFADNSKYWNIDGHVENSPSGGMTLYSNGSIYQDVVLDAGSTYLVTLYATTTLGATSADLAITFGQASATLHLTVPTANESVKIATQTLSPGAADYDPDTYRLKIKNVAPVGHLATPVSIRFACISTDAPVEAPGTCYWNEPSAAGLQSDDWSKDSGVTYHAPAGLGSSGQYWIPATEAIWRAIDISAFTDRDTKFVLTTHTTNGTGTPITSPYGRWHAYVRDHDTLDLIQDIGTWDTLPIIVTINRSEFTLTAGEHVAGDLVLENDSDLIDSTGWEQKVNNICLTVEGGVWPGYHNADVGALTCALPAEPAMIQDINVENLLSWVVSWLQYGWRYLGYVLQCLLWATILSIATGIGQFGIWLGLAIAAFGAWIADGVRFMFNNLQAWAIPILNQVIAWLFSLPFIQSLVDVAGIALIWFNGLFDFIMTVLSLFLLAVQFLVALLNLIPIAWGAFLTGMNAPSTITFPIPDCTNPATPFYQACLPFDVMSFLFSVVFMLPILLNVAIFAKAWRVLRRAWRNVSEELATS